MGIRIREYCLKKAKVQDTNINHLKLEVHDTYEKDEKITTNYEAINDEDVKTKLSQTKNY